MQRVDNNKYRVLCVDDNKNNLFTLNALLATVQNIDSIEVLSAKEALDVLLTQKVDLILCDVQMPEINGFEFAKMIKSNKKTKDIPIIFVTAVFKSEEFVKEGFELGAVDYITKPIDDNQLLNKITLYLKIFEQQSKMIQSEKKFHDIAQSISDGIYTINLKDETTFINDEALRLLGFERYELMGKRVHDQIHYKDINNEPYLAKDCPLHKAVDGGQRKEYENEVLIKKDGSFLYVSMIVFPLYVGGSVVGSVAIFKDKTNQNLIKDLEYEKIKNQEQIIRSMIDMIESRDSYTAGHTRRVASYCVLIAKEMRYSEDEIELLKNAAWLHDIGKISTPDSILLKPGKLDEIEFTLIKEHLNTGYEMLSKIDQYKVIATIMREHHEKYDGSGYPRGLKGDAIQPLSRIMMVADAFDAMTTNRIYKPRKSIEVALKELEELSAVHFHPDVVQAALRALAHVEIDTEISQLPKSEIEERRLSYFYKDRLTNLFIIEYLELVLRYYIKSSDVYSYEIKLHHFTEFNNQVGWSKGDAFLVKFASYIEQNYRESVVFRVEGDDFLILSEVKLEQISSQIQKCKLFDETVIDFSINENYLEDKNSLTQIIR